MNNVSLYFLIVRFRFSEIGSKHPIPLPQSRGASQADIELSCLIHETDDSEVGVQLYDPHLT